MVLDDTLFRIITQIQKEVKVNFKTDLSVEQVHGVVNAQIEATKLGFSRGITIHWTRFCKFVYTAKQKRKIEIASYLDLLDNRGDKNPVEILEAKKLLVIKKAEEKRSIINNDRSNQGSFSSTLEDIKKIEVSKNNNFITFKCLNSKHSKSNTNE
jgi:hypothetical protein